MNWFLCRNLIDEKSHKFKGDFEENSQESSIPPALLSFVSCAMHGSSATSCKNEYYKQGILSVRQLMKYNTFIWTRKNSLSPDHSTQREPLLNTKGATFACLPWLEDSQVIEVRVMHIETSIVPAFNIHGQYFKWGQWKRWCGSSSELKAKNLKQWN